MNTNSTHSIKDNITLCEAKKLSPFTINSQHTFLSLNKVKIYVVDEIMGKGKTSAALNYINNSDNTERFIYISPYLTEVDRVKEYCACKEFKEPKVYGTKLQGLKHLLKQNENIVTTHALFYLFDVEIIELIKTQEYTLIMDEVVDVVFPFYVSPDDAKTLEKYTYTENNVLKWKQEYKDYVGKFTKEKNMCETNSLVKHKDKLLWLFPIHIFTSFKEIYVLTFLFNAQVQRCYYDYYNLEYEYRYVKGYSPDTYEFTNTSSTLPDISPLIKIYEGKINNIGEKDFSLSKKWYKYNDLSQLQKNTFNYFNNILHSRSSNNIWTTFKHYKQDVSGKGYTKGFVSSNMRATNKYRDRSSVAYLINKYFNPVVKQFFEQNNIEMDEQGYALSEMLQFIWRSCIRDGKPINLYLPSKRMRNILKNWLEENKSIIETTDTNTTETTMVKYDKKSI